ncbi:hypothetical protein M3612_03390 [Niallia taxi]|uniref:hypothetical protein n=1 Tax=Niallia taxi TaxID=2499688 RepID=UPI00203B6E84|nr:hypothetical protein [Niallia taxi]MCM3213571.1 hypothetical protein [Niallia taxi]
MRINDFIKKGTEDVSKSIIMGSDLVQTSSASTQNVSAATEEQFATMEEISSGFSFSSYISRKSSK